MLLDAIGHSNHRHALVSDGEKESALQMLVREDGAPLASSLFVKYDETASPAQSGTPSMRRTSLDTFYNAFYESYWSKYTNLKTVIFVATVRGSGSVALYSKTVSGTFEVSREYFDSAEAIRIDIRHDIRPLGGFDRAGRLFLVMETDSRAQLLDYYVLPADGQASDVRLSIGICTFNRQDYLYRTLRSLDRILESPHVDRIDVVNQGSEFSLPALVEFLAAQPKIRVFRQSNMGGCGGFTRSMVEARERASSDYHILMDDDIHLSANVVISARGFLRYLKEPCVLGGQMLDMLRPSHLYEAGAFVTSDNTIVSIGKDLCLADDSSLDFFLRAESCDFNAWWFCAIPVEAIGKVGLPVNIFIRGDDMEYGLRLREAGVETISLPGVGVWHEPFYAKPQGWLQYYDLRNRLIVAALHPDICSLDSPIKLLSRVIHAIALHDYSRSFLILSAIEDFIEGPTLLKQNPLKLHQHVSTLGKRYEPNVARPSATQMPPPNAAMPKSKGAHSVAVMIALICALSCVFAKTVVSLEDKDINVLSIRGRSYIKTNSMRSYFHLYRPRPLEIIRQLIVTARVLLSYSLRRNVISKTWHQRKDELASLEGWLTRFR